MKWLEMIHLRSYSQPDRDHALAAFHQLSLPDRERGLQDIVLLRHTALENDLSMIIRWEDGDAGTEKSRVGLQLAAAFMEFGQINHSVWVYEDSVPNENKENP